VAGLLGSEAGEPSGGFGYGRAGFGPGGGGTGWGTIGTGRYGQIGHGSGTNGGGIAGTGGLRGRHTVPEVTFVPGAAVAGDLDAAIVRRYLKRSANRLLYCYEKELLATPTLAGSVGVRFEIQVDGTVASPVAATPDVATMAPVGTCVAAVIQAIEFPKPKTGTVKVDFAFKFSYPKP
jgi:hypothetical protein